MADPFSVVSGAVGIVSLGITACKGLLFYINSTAGASETVRSTSDMARFLLGLLEQIEVYLNDPNLDKATLQLVTTGVEDCRAAVERLHKKTEKLLDTSKDARTARVIAQKAVFAFHEGKLAKLGDLCRELKSNLSIALSVLNINIGHVSQQKLDSMTVALAGVQQSVSGVERNHEDEQFAEVSKWLSPRLYGESQQRQREALNLTGRQGGFANSVKASKEFEDWCKTPGKVLWCHGQPGTGKTVLASHLIEHLSAVAAKEASGIAYLYCSYKDWEKHSAVALLGHINQQLLSARKSLFSKVHDIYQPHVRTGSRPLLNEQVDLLRMLIENRKTVVVVDALDELTTTDDCQKVVIDQLCKLCPAISLIVTSRPLPGLRDMLAASIQIEVRTTVEDMRGYLEHCLPRSEKMRNHIKAEPTLVDEICVKVIDKSQGMFLMARLYLESLLDKFTRRKVKDALKTLPNGLDQAYDKAVGRIKSQGDEGSEAALLALAWIVSSRRPLSLSEVLAAQAVVPGDQELDTENMPDRADLLAACAGIVIYNEETDVVTLVHYTLQEYFDRNPSSLFSEAHASISRTCLTVMLFDQYATLDLSSAPQTAKSLLRQPLLAYAVNYWGWHQNKAGPATNLDLVLRLLRDRNRVATACGLMSAQGMLLNDSHQEPRQDVQGLSLAAYFGLAEAVQSLISSGMSVQAEDSRGWSALHWAAAGGKLETTKTLIRHGARVDAQDELGWTPLHRAAENDSPEVTRSLIEKGAEVNSVDRYGGTPLYRAAQSGASAIVNELLAKGAKTEIANQYLQTALHRAAASGYTEIVKALLASGARPDAKDNWGYTPRILATDNEHDEVAALLPLPYRIKGRGSVAR